MLVGMDLSARSYAAVPADDPKELR